MFRVSVLKITTPLLRRFDSSAVIGPKINSTAELEQLFSKSTWNTNELLNYTHDSESTTQVDKNILKHLLTLAGLTTNLSVEQEQRMLSSLNEQLKFINQLHSTEIKSENTDDGSHIIRLMNDLSINDDMNYEDLINDIENTKINVEKGEVENSWKATSLSGETEDDYFIVKEGLIKKNKQ